MQIIPAIDIMNGRCVRLTAGDFSARTNYDLKPIDAARRFADAGARALHIVDLDGAKERKRQNQAAIAEVLGAFAARLDIQVGGGVREAEDVEALLGAGARRVVVGSLLAQNFDRVAAWAERFSPARLCAALDLKGGEVSIAGWQESAAIGVYALLQKITALGITRVLVTAIERDGTLGGPDVALYRRLVADYSALEIIASGGVGTRAHLDALAETGVYGVVVGKAFYAQTITLNDLFKDISC